MIPIASGQQCRRYSLADIQLATQNFDNGLVIGQGGFGKVYKGHINIEEGSSTVVAIKRLDSMSDQGAPEFRAEIEMLSKLRHSNLVSLLGCCDDGKEMILVYEYVPHGALDHHLHDSGTPLSWMQRLTISIGAARGLDYLHTGAGTKHGVIHRDVKSSNILLDEDWAAKISDFGLAKISPINQQSTNVNTVIKGTFGYLDPEIFLTGKLTRKTDVFAFGVVLFELLSGRHAVFPDEDLSLARWAQNCVKKRNLDQIVGDEIRGQLSPKSLKEFAQIAYRCLHSIPKKRPTMSEVVVALQLSLTLQEKFNRSAQPAGVIGFTWKMHKYILLPTKENSGRGDTKSSRNRKIDINCSLLPAEDGGDRNEVPPGRGDSKSSADGKINIDRSSVPAKDGGDQNEVLPGSKQILTQDLKKFSYTDLEGATRKFGNPIMMSRHDRVFKGWVDEKTYSSSVLDVGLAISVERLHSFEWDLQILGGYSHPNLLKLLGYCKEKEASYLVYEFMEKRSLKNYLHEGAAAELPFMKRVKIAVGVARGLVFLESKQLIIRDLVLDSDEIWVDKDFNAKLLGFNVAKLVNRLPAYPSTGSLSQKRWCDVYGLGMVLMEILTGHPIFTKPYMDFVEKKHFYVEIAEMSNKMIEGVVDPRMKLDAPQTERARELFSLILKCTGYRPYTMEQALEELEQINSRVIER